MRKHFQQIDVLKGAAIIAVIALHSATKTELIQSYAIYHIWQAVPVFMILMGLNLGLGIKPDSHDLTTLYSRSYFTKKATRILLPLLLMFLISALLGLLWHLLYKRDVMDFTLYSFIGLLPVSGKGNYFITLLLQSILVLPVISFGFSKKPILTTVVLVILEVVFLLLSKEYGLFESKSEKYLYSAALPRYFSALAFGLWLSEAIRQPLRIHVLMGFLLPAIIAIVYLYLIVYSGLPTPMIYTDWSTQLVLSFGYPALLILVIIYLLPAQSGNFILRIFAKIGQGSYHIFLVQVLYFGLILEHGNLLLNLAVCLSLGYLFFILETFLSKKYCG